MGLTGIIAFRNVARNLGLLVVLAIVSFFYAVQAQAAKVTLAWNASTSSGVAGYQISYGQTSGRYATHVDVGNQTSYTLTGLNDGATYYFAAKAYNSGKTTFSGFSNEVSTTTALTPTASSTTASSTTAPTASFSTSLTSGTAPLTVTFSDTSTGSIATRLWSFGDGTSSTAKSGAKTYSTANTYTMSLTVTGSGGSTTATKTISATTAAPVAGVTANLANSSTETELVAAYNFEEASGTTVVDISGKGNNGTVSGATRITQGRFGKALSFDGVNDWVTVNDTASLDLTAGMTLEAWVYPTIDMAQWATVVLKEQPSGLVYSLQANSDANKPSMAARIGGSNRNLRGGLWLLANQWTHLAASYDGNTERLYVNGTQVAQRPQTGPIQASSSPLRVGGNSVWGQFFKGRIDEIRVYNRALRATEIQTDMNRSVATSSPPVTLVGTKMIGPVTDSNPQGKAEAFQTIAATTGMVTSLSVYVDSSSTATKLVAGLYKNKNGHPGTLLAKGTLTSPKAGSWNTVSLAAKPLTAGSKYWIAILSPSGVLQFRDNMGEASRPSETSAQSTLKSLPTTWASGTFYSYRSLSAYGAGYR
jgi:PKD repeat protein